MGSGADSAVPDWDVVCPRCEYPLRGLPDRRCPECGTRFDLEDVVKPWTRTREPRHRPADRPVADFGLRCASCGAELAGAPDSVCTGCGCFFDLDSLVPTGEWIPLKPESYLPLNWADIQILLNEDEIPAVPIRRTGIASTMLGGNAVGTAWMVPREYVLDFLAAVASARRRLTEARVRDAEPDRPCPTCFAENPAHFEICWSCCERINGNDGRP